eukprot:tig00000863_g4985.t1
MAFVVAAPLRVPAAAVARVEVSCSSSTPVSGRRVLPATPAARTALRSWISPLQLAAAPQRAVPHVCAKFEESVPVSDRIWAALPYMLPLIDGLVFGKYVFRQFPALGAAIVLPLSPFIAVYTSLPFIGLILYIALFQFVIRNPEISRFVRFNALQAMFVDILLVIPGLAGSLNITKNVPLIVSETASNTVFYSVLVIVAYGVGASLAGKLADQIPVVSDSVNSQV